MIKDQLIEPEKSCLSPDMFKGTCRHIQECSSLLGDFKNKATDKEYIEYIQLSNEQCKNVEGHVCEIF